MPNEFCNLKHVTWNVEIQELLNIESNYGSECVICYIDFFKSKGRYLDLYSKFEIILLMMHKRGNIP